MTTAFPHFLRYWELRYPALGLLLVLSGCKSTPADTPPAMTDDAGPGWLGDAGLTVRAPEARPLHSLLGISADLPLGADPTSVARRKASLDAAIDLGGVMIRRDFAWNDIEPMKGMSDYSGYDRVVNDATLRGVRLLPILDYGVKWANAAATDEYFPPTDPADFARFAGATAQRYQGKMVAWEVWNEPNNGFRFWKGAPSAEIRERTARSSPPPMTRSGRPTARRR